MDYEKKYKEALEMAKRMFSEKELYYLFPELKESKDEKIRKWIIDDIRYNMNNEPLSNSEYRKKAEKAIAWLEKQSKQEEPQVYDTGDGEVITYSETEGYKVVEPKFKVGDWISNNMCDVHIASIEDGMYYFDEGDGLSIVFVDEHYHLWTIQDAMDGDVLAFKNNSGIIICKSPTNYDTRSYCRLIYNNLIKEESGWDSTLLVPATKEQRDLLFQKMKEAGYEWDSKKKELKIIDWSKYIKYEPNSPSTIEENTMWSKYDEENLNEIIKLLPDLPFRHKWLKSLKDRVQLQPKQEWSEEDEKRLNSCLNILRPKTLFGNTEISNIDTINTKWLRSLKDRIQLHKQ